MTEANETEREVNETEAASEAPTETNADAANDVQAATETNADAANDPAAQIAALEEQVKTLKDARLRAAADLDNFRKRARRDVDEAKKRAREDILREILPMVDNLERAVAASGDASDANVIAEGVQMVLRSFEDIATRVELARVKSIGERFDPTKHEAVGQIPSDEHPAGTVCVEHIAGYVLGERLLRPAMVVVSSGAPAAPAPEADAEAKGDSGDDVVFVDGEAEGEEPTPGDAEA